jgi:hypothetical protein
LLSATVEIGVIKHWWGYLAQEANLGVVTDKLIVIDIDPRHEGDESLRVLEREHKMPPTWRALTGGGGEHVMFACPDGVEVPSSQAATNPVLGPGIDVRARGGYIVAPPSRHISGRAYVWSVDHHPQDVPLAPAPDWLVARLVERAAKEREGALAPEIWQQLTKSVPEYPDAAAAQIFGHLLRHWVDPYLAASLLHAWNKAYVDPPIPDAELTRIINRIARREDARRARRQGGEHERG